MKYHGNLQTHSQTDGSECPGQDDALRISARALGVLKDKLRNVLVEYHTLQPEERKTAVDVSEHCECGYYWDVLVCKKIMEQCCILGQTTLSNHGDIFSSD